MLPREPDAYSGNRSNQRANKIRTLNVDALDANRLERNIAVVDFATAGTSTASSFLGLAAPPAATLTAAAAAAAAV